MKFTKKVFALLLTAATLFAFAACGGDKPANADTTSPDDLESFTWPEETIPAGETETTGDVNTTETEAPTAEPSSADASAGTTKPADGVTVSSTETTTAAVKVPQTTAELVAYFNEVADRVKTEKPGYTGTHQITIGEPQSSSGLLQTVANFAIPLVPQDEDIIEPVPKGSSEHKWFGAALQPYGARLTPAMVKKITLTEKGNQYILRVDMKDEKRSSLPKNGAEHDHGKVYEVFTYDAIYSNIESFSWFAVIESFAPTYKNSYVIYTIDKATNRVRKAEYMMTMNADIQARLKPFSSFTATCDISQRRVFTIN
ncbi:MAG: hypothetical protein FWF05_03870 [Oscillospiraceae bacterium]|nr:hypothetical protein [Oscillospiraceae bacterium]